MPSHFVPQRELATFTPVLRLNDLAGWEVEYREAGRSHSSTMLSADIIEGIRICCRRPPFRKKGF